MIELGSSTDHFRRTVKPHIERELHRPLLERGIRLVTQDIKSGDGIEISGDIFDPEVQKKLAALQPRSLMCCNIFEHVHDRAALASVCNTLLPVDGILIVSVPYAFPYHSDPVDTLFRPTPDELAALFPDFEICFHTILSDSNYWGDLVSQGYLKGFTMLFRRIIKHGLPISGIKRWKEKNHRLLWLFRSYKVSIVVLKKS